EPRRVAYHSLKTVRELGGILVQTCTDHRTETVIMAGYQMYFAQRYGGTSESEVKRAHVFTSSPHNQKIELLWSLIRKRNGRRIHHEFQQSIDSG
ncbi:hypothetical protein CROQUDRAFT_49251, partial [Cronartium quercuum f. sp. fusiforme G11]